MKRIAYTALSLITLFGTHTALAAGDAAAGKTKAALCASCHGADGIASIPVYPNLAGQNEAYIVAQLKAFRSKKRNGGQAVVMQMQAANLSDADIDDLAAHFSSLK